MHERVDTHAHFVPPSWRKALVDSGHGKPDGMPAIPVSFDNVVCWRVVCQSNTPTAME